MVAAGGILFALSLLNPANRWVRLGLGAAAGIGIAGAFAYFFPQCLGRPEGVSEELQQVWLNNVREARPIYRHSLESAFPIAALPVIGIIGALAATWRWRKTEAVVGWAAIALFTTFAGAMLLWQVRAGPAGQLLSVAGSTALVWIIVPWCLRQKWMAVRVIGSVVVFLVVSGLFAGYVIRYLPKEDKPAAKGTARVNNANAMCARMTSMRMLDKAIPPSILFTHVDLGPRLIVMTRHSGIAGPYHRNGRAILDVHKAFTGTAAQFRPIARAHGAQYLLTCPNLAETTVYRARSPQGFYTMLKPGKAPKWLEPVPLPRDAPYRLWKIRYDLPDDPIPPAPKPVPPQGSPESRR
jgi:hypothetical protein